MTIQPKPAVKTRSEFQRKILQQGLPALVLFASSRCGRSCRMEKVLESLSPHWKDRLVIHRIDIDTSRSVAADFGIQATPVLMFFRDGVEEHRILGSIPLEHLERTLITLLP